MTKEVGQLEIGNGDNGGKKVFAEQGAKQRKTTQKKQCLIIQVIKCLK